MTARQNKRPVPVPKVTSDESQCFEALALATIERSPTAAWANAIALWRGLSSESVWPSTRGRILRRLLEVAAKRGDPWPPKLVKRFAEAAAPAFPDTKARGRVRDAEGLKLAAFYKAHHQNASWDEMAKAAGTKRETVRQWVKRADFQKHRADEEFRIKLAEMSARIWAKPVILI